MSLDFAILGWLETGPGSGYDLVRQMDQGLSWFWGAAHSQIYPRLRELEANGLITSESVTVGSRLEKRLYSITNEGRTAIRKWASEPPTYPPNRDNERLRLIFGDHNNLDDIRRHLETHRDRHKQRLDDLERFLDVLTQRKHPRIEKRIGDADTPLEKQLVLAVREMAYAGDVERAKLEIDWATSCLEWLDDLESGAEPRPAVDAVRLGVRGGYAPRSSGRKRSQR